MENNDRESNGIELTQATGTTGAQIGGEETAWSPITKARRKKSSAPRANESNQEVKTAPKESTPPEAVEKKEPQDTKNLEAVSLPEPVEKAKPQKKKSSLIENIKKKLAQNGLELKKKADDNAQKKEKKKRELRRDDDGSIFNLKFIKDTVSLVYFLILLAVIGIPAFLLVYTIIAFFL